MALVRRSDTVQDKHGLPVEGAVVSVRNNDATGAVAAIYADAAPVVRILSGKVVTDSAGVYSYWADNGSYVETIDYCGCDPAYAYFIVDSNTSGSTSITVTTETVTVAIGGTLTLTPSIINGGPVTTWVSLEPGIATVSSTGVVTGVSLGSTVIRAENNGAFDTVTILVIEQQIAPTNAALPTITGNLNLGSVLTLNFGSWNGTAPLTLTRIIQRSTDNGATWVDVTQASNSPSYTIQSADVGAQLRVSVLAVNAAGSAVAVSSPTASITNSRPTNTAVPVITGTTTEGQTLTASTGTWTGPGPISFTYLWQRSTDGGTIWADISTAGASYLLQAADAGAAIRVQVTATNAAGATTATSAATAVIVGLTAPINVSLPTISGSLVVGATLTATTGTWTSPNPPSFAYQWVRRAAGAVGFPTVIPGATASTYTLQSGDADAQIAVNVTATNSVGPTLVQSAISSAVQAGVAPALSAIGTISGSPVVGQVLLAPSVSFTGLPAPTITWQWLRNGTAISGATTNQYTVQTADIGASISVRATGTNLVGSASATTAAVGPVAAAVDLRPRFFYAAATVDPATLTAAWQAATPVAGSTSGAANVGSAGSPLTLGTPPSGEYLFYAVLSSAAPNGLQFTSTVSGPEPWNGGASTGPVSNQAVPSVPATTAGDGNGNTIKFFRRNLPNVGFQGFVTAV